MDCKWKREYNSYRENPLCVLSFCTRKLFSWKPRIWITADRIWMMKFTQRAKDLESFYWRITVFNSEYRTVFRERSSRKTVIYEEQIMSKDNYPSIFVSQMEAIVVIIPQIFFRNARSFENWEIFLNNYSTSARWIFSFIKSILKSLVFLAIWLALISAIYPRIAPLIFLALNRIFFSANENGTVKQKNQSDFKVRF